MDAPLQFRTATAADVEAVIALVQSAYRGESGLRGWTTETGLLDGQRTDRREVSELIARPDSLILLAEHGGRLVGSCHLQKDGEGAYFGMFAVDPESQRGGVGKQILAEAERVAVERWRSRVMRMTVIVQRAELIAWYERRGYRRTGKFEPFPYGDERFGIPKRDDLRFELLEKALGSASLGLC
ncbi:MAG: GNAT family N-acetyltransferase [Myxococcales bacterium]